jgi:enoyl-CoA hydratase/carnithine racemase
MFITGHLTGNSVDGESAVVAVKDVVVGADLDRGGLRVEHASDGVCQVIFDRPGTSNALDPDTAADLVRELRAIGADPNVRAVILTGANGGFCSGADLNVIDRFSEVSEAEVTATLRHIMRASALLRDLSRPTIAVVGGPAVGAGMALALSCDVRIASPSAILLPAFIRMGLLPDCGLSWLLPRMIGEGAALEMLIAGRAVDAERAERLGLFSQVCDDPMAAATELARMFAARPPAAVAATKRLLRTVATGSLDDAIDAEAVAQAAAFHGAEFAEHFAAWRSHRNAD